MWHVCLTGGCHRYRNEVTLDNLAEFTSMIDRKSGKNISMDVAIGDDSNTAIEPSEDSSSSTTSKTPRKNLAKGGWWEPPERRWTEGTWINCDARYFNLAALGGDFDIVHMDPPW